MHANCVPDNSGEQLDAVEDGDEDGSQDTKFPQQSQTHNQHWLNCKIAKKKSYELTILPMICKREIKITLLFSTTRCSDAY